MTNHELIREVAELMGYEIDPVSPFAGDSIYVKLPSESVFWAWNPLHNANHWMMVVERMQKLWWHIVIEMWPDHWYVRFQGGIGRPYSEETGSLGRAILLAALEAITAVQKSNIW